MRALLGHGGELVGSAPVFAVEMVPGYACQRTEHRSFLSR
jgi:hypothetical protein